MGSTPRTAGLAGESFAFDAPASLPCDGERVTWSGGGTPATGTGARFETVLSTGGRHTVVARCGGQQARFEVEVCPMDEFLDRARAFYGSSVDFGRVRVRASRLVLGPPRSGWTCNNVIRIRRPRNADELPGPALLIHEVAHVWQHQRGDAQLLHGLVEQVGRRLKGSDPYDYGGPEGVRAAGDLTEFGFEGQAQVVTEYWKSQHGFTTDRKGVAFTTPGYVADLRRLVEGAGIGEQRPRKLSLAGVADTVAALLVNVLLTRFE